MSLGATQAVRFVIEVTKAFGRSRCRFHDSAQWETIQRRYGSMAPLMTADRE